MGINIKKNDAQAQLWAVPGPILVCCILLTIVLRPLATPLLLPITAVAGVVACHIWKWRGVAISSAFLVAMLAYFLQSQPSQSWIWTIALTLSIASTFVVTVLCSEEAHHTWNVLNNDSKDHKQTVAHLNERFQLIQNKLTSEQNELNLQIEQLQQQITAKEEKQRANEQLLKLARNEMTATYAKQEKLMEELLATRQNSAAMEVKIHELQELVNPEVLSFNKASLQDLQSRLDVSHEQIEQLKFEIRETQTKEQRASQQVKDLAAQIVSLEHHQKSESEAKLQEKEKQHGIELQQAHQAATTLSQEKALLETTLLRLQEELEIAVLQNQENTKQAEVNQLSLQTAQYAFAQNELVLKEKISELENQIQNLSTVHDQTHDLQKQIEQEQAELKLLHQQVEEMQLGKCAMDQLLAKAKANENALEKQVEELFVQCQQLEDRCEVLNKNQHDLEHEKSAFEAQVQKLQAEKIVSQQQYEEVKANENELQLQVKALSEHSLEFEQLKHKLADFDVLQQENHELLQKLSHQKEAVVILSAEKEQLIDQLQQLQVKQQEALETVVDDRELRRLEGLYQQLRQQFSEKTDVLASTRRELFTTQEKLLALQKDIEEAKIYDDSESSESLHRLIAAAESELALAEQQHTVEINRLHEVIDSLMARV